MHLARLAKARSSGCYPSCTTAHPPSLGAASLVVANEAMLHTSSTVPPRAVHMSAHDLRPGEFGSTQDQRYADGASRIPQSQCQSHASDELLRVTHLSRPEAAKACGSGDADAHL